MLSDWCRRAVVVSATALTLSPAPGFTQGAPPPTVRAHRITDPIRLDGRLDEPVYAMTPAITDFVQQEPDEFKPATEKTEAWIFFDDRSEERREGKSVDLGGRRIIKKKKKRCRCETGSKEKEN